jgi:hypothetical protein
VFMLSPKVPGVCGVVSEVTHVEKDTFRPKGDVKEILGPEYSYLV